MRKAHREAARALLDNSNSNNNTTPPSPPSESTPEFYIDLHGLHPEEAVEYLDSVLQTHTTTPTNNPPPNPPPSTTDSKPKPPPSIIYAITGTGHHSKNGKDKVGKAVRAWLADVGYVFREFSVPGERGGYVGGILGVDCASAGGSGVTGARGVGDGEGGGVGAGGLDEASGSGNRDGDGDGDGDADESGNAIANAAMLAGGLPVPAIGGKIPVLKREDDGTSAS